MTEAAILAVFLAFSAFFSAAESALFSIPRLRLTLLEREKGPRARAIVETMRHPNAALITILIGNNIANLGSTALATATAVALFGERGVAYAVPIMTILILFVTEAGPKTFAIRHPERVARMIIGPLQVTSFLLGPLRVLIGALVDALLLPIVRRVAAPGSAKESRESVTALLAAAVEYGHDEGIIAPFEKEIFDNVTEVHELVVREVMTPRTEIVALPASTGVADARRFVAEKKITRIPVYQGRFESLVGLLHASDLAGGRAGGAERSIRPLLRPLFYVPESKPVVELLLEFRKRGVHFAVAVEESGGIAGIVTLEDILEEIVGEIRDERHVAHSQYRRRSPDSIIVSARMELATFNDLMEVLLESEVAETLGGFVLARTGRIPKAGEVFLLDGLTFYVRRAEPNRLIELEVTRPPASAEVLR